MLQQGCWKTNHHCNHSSNFWIDKSLKILQKLCSLNYCWKFSLWQLIVSQITSMSDTNKYPKEKKLILTSFVQKSSSNKCQFYCDPCFKVSMARSFHLSKINQLNLPNLETEDLKIEFLSFEELTIAFLPSLKTCFSLKGLETEILILKIQTSPFRITAILTSDHTKTVICFFGT